MLLGELKTSFYQLVSSILLMVHFMKLGAFVLSVFLILACISQRFQLTLLMLHRTR